MGGLRVFKKEDSIYMNSSGGPAGLVYGFLLVCAGTLATFATLGELASMYESLAPAI